MSRILLVEDEEAVLLLNKRHLEKNGYEVYSATTIKQAEAIIWEYPPDLIILDVMLPDGSGLDLCRKIRDISTAPVLFLSCLSDNSDIIRGLDNGGDDYLPKPYSIDVLLARVATLLRRSKNPIGIIELPPLRINLSNGKVTLEKEEILLSQKELQLLAFLAQHAGCEYSSKELYNAVWGEDNETSTGTVKAHISRLRSKLHLNDMSPFELIFTPEKKYMFLKVRFSPE
ncbi:MAG: response regulator transcription factor [Lachnospiraceae bacterium]|nr:response regulator transcription factor [Lachnospiraceae bacterium]